MDIINFFGDFIAINLFIQGVFFSICLVSGLFMIASDQHMYFKGNEANNLNEYILQLNKFAQRYFDFITVDVISIFNGKTKNHTEGSIKTAFFGPNKIKLSRGSTVIFLLILILMVFVSGVLVNTIADKWMDLPLTYHYGLKKTWILEKDKLSYSDTDQYIKEEVFDVVYADIFQKSIGNSFEGSKIEFYYHAKHALLADNFWRNYLSTTQKLINLTQVFALSFFLLFSLTYLNFIINVYRQLKRDNKTYSLVILMGIFSTFLVIIILNSALHFPAALLSIFLIFPVIVQLVLFFSKRNIFISFTSLLVIYISFSGYWLSCKAWVNNEEEVAAKTYGAYRLINEDLRTKAVDELVKLNNQ